jgi:hypothetical protein
VQSGSEPFGLWGVTLSIQVKMIYLTIICLVRASNLSIREYISTRGKKFYMCKANENHGSGGNSYKKN